MPKKTINIYLPDALAERMAKYGLPWSKIAQDAFEAAMNFVDKPKPQWFPTEQIHIPPVK